MARLGRKPSCGCTLRRRAHAYCTSLRHEWLAGTAELSRRGSLRRQTKNVCAASTVARSSFSQLRRLQWHLREVRLLGRGSLFPEVLFATGCEFPPGRGGVTRAQRWREGSERPFNYTYGSTESADFSSGFAYNTKLYNAPVSHRKTGAAPPPPPPPSSVVQDVAVDFI